MQGNLNSEMLLVAFNFNYTLIREVYGYRQTSCIKGTRVKYIFVWKVIYYLYYTLFLYYKY